MVTTPPPFGKLCYKKGGLVGRGLNLIHTRALNIGPEDTPVWKWRECSEPGLRLQLRGLSVRDFSPKKGVIQWEDQKKGQTVRIWQTLADFLGKKYKFGHIFDRNFGKRMEILSKFFLKGS